MSAFNSVDELYRSLIDECSSLSEKNLEVEESIIETLFRDQRYDLVLYALEKGFTLSSERVKQIKISGDLKLYQYLFQDQKLEFNLKLMSLAVKSGKIETVKWLRENGCPWDKWTCQYAAEKGYLEILKWAREHGCPWNKEECLREAKNYPEIVEWIKSN
jgi:hypothetical protein